MATPTGTDTGKTDMKQGSTDTDQSAETENTDTGQDGGTGPSPVPYARFKEVNDKLNQLLKAQSKAESENEKAQMAKLAEEKRFQEIIDKLTPQADRATALEGVIASVLKTRLEAVPEDKRELIPDGPPEIQLGWVDKALAAGLFGKPLAPDTHAGAGSGSGADRLASGANEQAAGERVAKKYNIKPGKDWLND